MLDWGRWSWVAAMTGGLSSSVAIPFVVSDVGFEAHIHELPWFPHCWTTSAPIKG